MEFLQSIYAFIASEAFFALLGAVASLAIVVLNYFFTKSDKNAWIENLVAVLEKIEAYAKSKKAKE
jgi:hypothetical protein